MADPQLQFWFEFASTYSYPSAMRIESLAVEQGVQVSWHAFMAGPIFQAQGWNDSPFNIYEAKGRYMWRDVERICAKYDIPFVRPSAFPRNGSLAARVACRFQDSSWLPAFVRAVYCANFECDEEISESEVVRRCIERCGEDAESVLGAALSDEAKPLLRQNTTRAVELGIFGAPTFIIGDEMFWGDDLLEDAIEWALKSVL